MIVNDSSILVFSETYLLRVNLLSFEVFQIFSGISVLQFCERHPSASTGPNSFMLVDLQVHEAAFNSSGFFTQ